MLNTKDPKSPTDPHWSWLLGTAIVKQASFFFQDVQHRVGQDWGYGTESQPSAVVDAGAPVSMGSAVVGPGAAECGDRGEKGPHLGTKHSDHV